MAAVRVVAAVRFTDSKIHRQSVCVCTRAYSSKPVTLTLALNVNVKRAGTLILNLTKIQTKPYS